MPLFGNKNKLQVSLGDLEEEKEKLLTYLQSNLKADVLINKDKLAFDPEKVSAQELQHLVTKFVYKHNLNSTHFVSVDGSTVKVERFKGARKPDKDKKNGSRHQSITQSWGL